MVEFLSRHEVFQVLVVHSDLNQVPGSCKGITLEVCLVMWVGSHLRAVVLPIAFSLSPIFPSVTYCVIPLNLIKDNV